MACIIYGAHVSYARILGPTSTSNDASYASYASVSTRCRCVSYYEFKIFAQSRVKWSICIFANPPPIGNWRSGFWVPYQPMFSVRCIKATHARALPPRSGMWQNYQYGKKHQKQINNIAQKHALLHMYIVHISSIYKTLCMACGSGGSVCGFWSAGFLWLLCLHVHTVGIDHHNFPFVVNYIFAICICMHTHILVYATFGVCTLATQRRKTVGTHRCLKSCKPLFTSKLCEMTVFLVQKEHKHCGRRR